MSSITTALEWRDGNVMAQRPGTGERVQLLHGDDRLDDPGVLAAIRRAYRMGREDATREVQATIRGVLGL